MARNCGERPSTYWKPNIATPLRRRWSSAVLQVPLRLLELIFVHRLRQSLLDLPGSLSAITLHFIAPCSPPISTACWVSRDLSRWNAIAINTYVGSGPPFEGFGLLPESTSGAHSDYHSYCGNWGHRKHKSVIWHLRLIEEAQTSTWFFRRQLKYPASRKNASRLNSLHGVSSCGIAKGGTSGIRTQLHQPRGFIPGRALVALSRRRSYHSVNRPVAVSRGYGETS